MKTWYAMVVCLVATMGLPLTAAADPEQAYQGGKAMRDSITGQKEKVDDRDFEQRARDRVREEGAKHGEALLSGGKEKQSGSDSGKKQTETWPRTDNPRRP